MITYCDVGFFTDSDVVGGFGALRTSSVGLCTQKQIKYPIAAPTTNDAIIKGKFLRSSGQGIVNSSH
jgi:hypothetical protein